MPPEPVSPPTPEPVPAEPRPAAAPAGGGEYIGEGVRRGVEVRNDALPFEESAAPLAYAGEAPQDYGDADVSSFAYEPPFRPRRNWAKIWTLAAAIFAIVALGSVAAIWRFGLPDWLPIARPTFAEAQVGLQLDFPPNRQDRRRLPNGKEFFGASGTITNTGQSRRSVPTILIVLRDAHDRIVYSSEIAPPKRQLAPGESVTINEAMTDVPKSAEFAEFGWKPG